MPKFLNYFDTLAQSDIRKMKKDLVAWAERNPNGILLFESPIMNEIFSKMSQQNIEGMLRSDNTLILEDLEIKWRNVGGRKAILESITQKYKGAGIRYIYFCESSWKESEIWYQFK